MKCVIRIFESNLQDLETINSLTKLDGQWSEDSGWSFEVPFFFEEDLLSAFVSSVRDAFEELRKRFDISIWLYHEYEGQCNLELTPKILIALSQLDVSLCFSCWESSLDESGIELDH